VPRRLRFRTQPTGLRRVVPSATPAPARPRVRLRVLGGVAAGLFALVLVRLWYLQVLQTKTYNSQVASEVYQVTQIPAPRGAIEARNGTPLVTNTAQEEITVSRADVQQHPDLIASLAALTGQSQMTLQTALANPQYTADQQIPVVQQATVAELTTLEQHRALFPGVRAVAVSVRSYPYGTTAAHVLGYVTPITQAELAAHKNQGYQPGDSFGQTGIEAEYQNYLRGVPGKQVVEVDSTGKQVGVVSTTPPRPGDTVVLNLDLGLQQALDQDLASEIATLHTQGFAAPTGAAVVMDPNTGAVLAMASYPTYNPSVWSGGISEANYQALTSPQSNDPLLNRAIAGLFTPGSTFKLATATAALQDGLITTSYTYDDATGTYTIPNCVGKCTYHNAGYEHLGVINITPAIAASDDVFFYNLGVMFWEQRATYGEDAIQKWANAYSLGTGTGIDLPGEQPGFVDSPQIEQKLHEQYPAAYPYPQWYAGNNLEMAFGQGATIVTPIELADAYSTFANGGTRYQPEVAAEILSPSGEVVKRFEPKVTGHVTLSPQNRAAMLAGFEGAVASPIGTSYYTFQGFPLSQFQVAGKTGTASVDTASGQKLAPNSLFVGFAPATNPQYVVAGVISQAGYGADGFAIVARNVFSYLMTHPVGGVTAASSPAATTGGGGSAGSSSTGAASAGSAEAGHRTSGHRRTAASTVRRGTARDTAFVQQGAGGAVPGGSAVGGSVPSDRPPRVPVIA
jgi:penicillin-binding protein 2